MNYGLREAVLRTIAYFDIFEYPLTSFEVWKYLEMPKGHVTIHEIEEELMRVREDGVLNCTHGFWTLVGREAAVTVRHERHQIAFRKFARARRAAWLLGKMPWIRMVAVCNTLAWNHARDESDIDFFIVTAPGALWKARFSAVLPFALMGLRPNGGRVRDPLCFSFFASETALEFQELALAPDDPYLLRWVASVVPLYDPDGLIEALWDANPWVLRALPHARPSSVSDERRVHGARSAWNEELRSGIFESLARGFQMIRFPESIRRVMNVDHRVVVTDDILKFHENDRRHEYREAYRVRCRALGL